MSTCKYAECGFSGEMKRYVGFFPSEAINNAHEKNQALPKYGFHYGEECPSCNRWQKWIPQSDSMLENKFYE